MVVIGIDPGIDITGFAVVKLEGQNMELLNCGVIRTERSHTTAQRLVELEADLRSLLSEYTEAVTVGVEELFFAKNVTTAFTVGAARGVILFTLASLGFTIEEVKPVEVKASVVGSGRATKQDIQRTIQLLFSLDAPPQPDDAADAVAIALTAAGRVRSQR